MSSEITPSGPAEVPVTAVPTWVPASAASAAAPTSSPATTATPADVVDNSKPIHTLVVDTGPLIKNDIAISTLVAQAEVLVTIPSVLEEIRDPATRARVELQLLPFLTFRTPTPASVKFVTDFARRTGDLEVLSKPDLYLVALTYELECERNGGDWRLRNSPTQKGVNGKSPAAIAALAAKEAEAKELESKPEAETPAETTETATETTPEATVESLEETVADLTVEETSAETVEETGEETGETEKTTENTASADTVVEETAEDQTAEEAAAEDDENPEDDSEGEWITPANLKKVQAREARGGAPTQSLKDAKVRLQAALLTADFAMQNVALRINLNLLSTDLDRITRVKTWVLRCHGCFTVTRKMDKQFCPQCGQSTLTRTSCSTDATTGEFKIHLKRNFQFNKRGNVYSVPKPIHGSASGKLNATTQGGRGGTGGWGRDLILSEDQQEFTRKTEEQKREERRGNVRDLMDMDYLPGILTGYRNSTSQRIKVGAGRNVNAKKRK
ncbi:20s-pre-rrna d-site endonuclease nob1 [Ophiostoma piceae UAMH 11346]|uniref:20S-pre-rRNA D-site endonuclease NOB1 n=1 Tax=Ophiostoma piceae (strain UAMH 11346) TaxID=1262450 RepID=S3D6X2_OPHP1|nr:20s-pre-rrna d-site endonuclease nob1 [Ophiostoma piceae UAMH 11346]